MVRKQTTLRVVLFLVFLNVSFMLFSKSSMLYQYDFPLFGYCVFTSLLFITNGLLTYLFFLVLGRSKSLFRILFYLLFLLNAITVLYYTHYTVFLSYATVVVGLSNLKHAGGYVSSVLLLELFFAGVLLPILLDVFYLRKKLNLFSKKENKNWRKEFLKVLTVYLLFYGGTSLIILERYKKNYAGGTNSEISFEYFLFPSNLVSWGKEWMKNLHNPLLKKYEKETDLDQYSLNKNLKDKPQTVVFIFGESLDASHLSPNGYNRETMPLLSQQKNITFLSKTKSCATNTGTAHPCMTKPFVTKDYLSSGNIYPLIMSPKIHSFLDIFKAKGFKTYYLGVLHGEPSLKLLFKGLDEYHFLNEEKSPVKYFKDLQKLIKDDAPKKLIVISTWGAHYPYVYNKNIAKFPKGSGGLRVDRVTTKKEKKKLYNNYDNSILYIDKLMNKTINLLKKTKQNSLVYFFSDHGENLDNPHFGIHGMDYLNAPYDVTHPGAFLWVSKKWLKNINPKTLNLFKRYKDKEFSYDNIFHSVLDCSGIKSKYIDRTKSLCKE